MSLKNTGSIQGILTNYTDAIGYSIFNSNAATRVYITAWFLTPQGMLIPYPFPEINPTDDRLENISTLPCIEGLLIGLQVYAANCRRGECFVSIGLLRANTSNGLTLARGYISDSDDVAWSCGYAKLESTLDGEGARRSVLGTDPAAGIEISEVVPTNAQWALKTLTFALATDATVANRSPIIVIDDGTNILWAKRIANNQTASQTITYYGMVSSLVGEVVTLPDISFALPPIRLSQGFHIRTVTTGLQAGDDYGPPRLYVEEWIED